MRRFELHRDEDKSGVSGTGVVAEGVQFGDGTVALRWGWNPYPATAVWESIHQVKEVHGHNGLTRVVWIDPDTDAGMKDDMLPMTVRVRYPGSQVEG